MFRKVSINSFVYHLIDVFVFPNEEIQKIHAEINIERCYLYQNLTDSTSFFFVFICDLKCSIDKRKTRDIICKVMIKSKIFERLDLSDGFWDQFSVRNNFFFYYIYNIQLTQKNKISITRYLKWVYLGIKHTNKKNMMTKSDYLCSRFIKIIIKKIL